MSTDRLPVLRLAGSLLLLAAVVAAAAAVVLARGPVAALAGVGYCLASLLALALSRTGDGILGFCGTGLEPVPETPAVIVVELAALAVLATVAAIERRPLADAIRDALPG